MFHTHVSQGSMEVTTCIPHSSLAGPDQHIYTYIHIYKNIKKKIKKILSYKWLLQPIC